MSGAVRLRLATEHPLSEPLRRGGSGLAKRHAPAAIAEHGGGLGLLHDWLMDALEQVYLVPGNGRRAGMGA